MKRIIKFVCILVVLFLFAGCTSTDEGKAETNESEETKASVANSSESKEIDKKEKILVKDFSVNEIDEEIDNIPMYHLSIDAKDDTGNIVWNYKTSNGIRAELEANQFLGKYKDRVYISESGAIVALDLNTGNEIWKNSDFETGGICFAFDQKDSIFFTGYYSGDIYGIDKDGRSILESPIPSGWCHKIVVEGDYLKVYSAGDGDYFYMNKNDGSSNYFNYFPSSNIEGSYLCKKLNKAGEVLVDVTISIHKDKEDNKLYISTGGYLTVNVSDGNGNYYDPEEAPADAYYNLRESAVFGSLRQISKDKYESYIDIGMEEGFRIEILQLNDTQIKTTLFSSNIDDSWVFTKENY